MLLASLALSIAGTAALTGPLPVEFKTTDGVPIHGWYIHAGEHEGERELLAEVPAIVLLHMYRSEKRAWEPLIDAARKKGVALLMIDMRGHGESKFDGKGNDLSKRVNGRDAEVFNSMYLDAEGAIRWLVDHGHDQKRIGLLGASVGCSVAIDTARRSDSLRTVGVLTPGTNYLGVPTMEHIADWGTRELLVVSSEEEAPKGAIPVRDALAKREDARLTYWELAETGVHGTRMFGKVKGIEARLIDWFAERLAPAK